MSIAEAAMVLGVSVDTVRRRVRSGGLTSRRRSDGRLLVMVPDDVATMGGDLSVSPELQAARVLIDELRRSRDDLAVMVAAFRLQMEQDAIERSELRRLLAQAQAQIGALLPPPPALASPVSDASVADVPARRRRWWPFVR